MKKEDFNKLMASVTNIVRLENIPKDQRLEWQSKTIDNIIAFSRNRSQFWRDRTEKYLAGDIESFNKIPILDRGAVRSQVFREKSLIKPDIDKVSVTWNETGGSTGNPFRFLVTSNNALYNAMRGFSQYVIENRDMSFNWVGTSRCKGQFNPFGIEIIREEHWGGYFRYFKTGSRTNLRYYENLVENKYIEYLNDMKVNGYLSVSPNPSRLIAKALYNNNLTMPDLGVRYILNRGDKLNPTLKFHADNNMVALRSTYSCEEIGPIGFSCPLDHEVYHVAATNAFVEHEDMPGMEGKRLLITGLNSFATPIIRYDIGDIGEVGEGCACGWIGQIITKLQGRRTGILKLSGGRFFAFHLDLQSFSAFNIDDMRITQHKYDQIDVEYIRSKNFNRADKIKFKKILCSAFFSDIEIKFTRVEKIYWGSGYKKHFFRCSI